MNTNIRFHPKSETIDGLLFHRELVTHQHSNPMHGLGLGVDVRETLNQRYALYVRFLRCDRGMAPATTQPTTRRAHNSPRECNFAPYFHTNHHGLCHKLSTIYSITPMVLFPSVQSLLEQYVSMAPQKNGHDPYSS